MTFTLFHAATPSADIDAMAGCTIPADQRAAGGLQERWLELVFTRDVAQHLRHAANAVGDGNARSVGERFLCDALKKLQEDLGGAALRRRAWFGVGGQEIHKTGAQPTLSRFSTGRGASCRGGWCWWWLVAAAQFKLAQGLRRQLTLRRKRTSE